MRRISVRTLAVLWVLCIALTWAQQRAWRSRVQGDTPSVRAETRDWQAAESVRVKHSVQPLELSAEKAPLWVSVALIAWIYKIPLALIWFTVVWLRARRSRSTSTYDALDG